MRIKWPNDLYSNGLKVGGILCQSVYREGAFHLVIGAGLNVSNKQPTTCIQTILEELSSQAGSSSNHQPISREVSVPQSQDPSDYMLPFRQARTALR